MKIEIELVEDNMWKVSEGDKYVDKLFYEEMIGLVAAITMPELRPCLTWLKTEDEHKAREIQINA
jgi:hypothetical protein